MRLTVLGSSGSVGGPGSPASGYLLSVPGEQPVVLDFGPGVLGALQHHHDPNDVALMVSHLHADHCLDIPGLLVWRRWAPVRAQGRVPLWGPPGTQQRIGVASSEYPGEVDDITDTFDVRVWPGNDEAVLVNGLKVRSRKVNHPPQTYGLRISGPDGATLAYSADTGICDELVELAADADIFLCEASWTHDPENRPPNLHMSGTEAGQVAARAGVRLLALTHIPPWTDAQAVRDEAAAEFDGPIAVCKPDDTFLIDGARVEAVPAQRHL